MADEAPEKAPVGQGKKYKWLQTETGKAYTKRHNARHGAKKQRAYRERHREVHLERHREQQRQWRAKPENKRKMKNHALLRAHGITVDDWDAMVQQQGGACGICRDDLDLAKGTAVDHDHATGKIRGLLCARCNTALGSFKDSPEILERAIQYLKKGGC